MNTVAVTLIVLFGGVWISGIILTIIAYINAPEGFEDEEGFHEYMTHEDKEREGDARLNLHRT
jgi:hypothetical protein